MHEGFDSGRHSYSHITQDTIFMKTEKALNRGEKLTNSTEGT